MQTLMPKISSSRNLLNAAVWMPSHRSRLPCLPHPLLSPLPSFAQEGHFWPPSSSLPNSFRINAIPTAPGQNCQVCPPGKLAAANAHLVKLLSGVFGLEKPLLRPQLHALLLEPRARTPFSFRHTTEPRPQTFFRCMVLRIYLKHRRPSFNLYEEV